MLPRLVTKGMFILGGWWRYCLLLFGGVRGGCYCWLCAVMPWAVVPFGAPGPMFCLSASSAEAAVSPLEWPVNLWPRREMRAS